MVELKLLSIIIYACGMVFISYICIYIQYMLVVVRIVSYTLPGRRAWGDEEEGSRNWKRSSTLLVKNLGGFGKHKLIRDLLRSIVVTHLASSQILCSIHGGRGSCVGSGGCQAESQ